MTSSENPLCFYCSEYAKVIKNYPLNVASNDKQTFTPRCSLHWKFECSKCGEMTHFNGISWCLECKKFTCLRCAREKMVKKDFLIYNYYYVIPCHNCRNHNPALDFAEFTGSHPFQKGDLELKKEVVVWIPTDNDKMQAQQFPYKSWGLERVLSLGKNPVFKRLNTLKDYTPISIWDNLAPSWLSVEEENYHHKYRILPEVYRMINIQKNDKILDVACGKGDVARNLTRRGAKVTGIDISKMLDYAIERENEEKLGITYLELNAQDIFEKFERASFDKVVCNMALMDIEDYKTTIKQISHVLKENGTFVFSITHPAFAFPSCTSLRIPEDTLRNEDRFKIVLDYYDDRPTIFSYGNMPPILQFPRTISSYLNELVNNNLILREMSEPKASKELVEKFPSEAHLDDELRPDFLIVKAIKKSNFQQT